MSAAPALRPLRHADASAVLDAFRSAPDMVRQGDVTTPEQAEAYVRRLTESGRHVFAVTVADRLVGSVGVLVDEEDRVGWSGTGCTPRTAAEGGCRPPWPRSRTGP